MSDAARKVFPMESVLALVMGKEHADVKDIAGYLTGRSLACDCCARLVGPLAAGWLACLYPAFAALEWDESTPWESFVAQVRRKAGDSVSMPPMPPRLQAMAGNMLGYLDDREAAIKAQGDEIACLRATVQELEPFQGKAQELEKKCAQLEDKVKSMTTDMGALRKELMPFQGKMAVDQQELMTMIKDAVKDNLKGLVIGAAAGAAVAAGDAATEESAEESGPAPDFGFGASGSDSDGFGF